MRVVSESRDIVMYPARHRCHTQPSKNYGITSPRVVWTLKVDNEAISWELYTDWGMPAEAFRDACPNCTHPRHRDGFPEGRTTIGAVDWHFATPPFEGMPYRDNCVVLGGPCWSDVGFLIGDVLFDLLRTKRQRRGVGTHAFATGRLPHGNGRAAVMTEQGPREEKAAVAEQIEAARAERARRRRQRFWVENEGRLWDRAVIEAAEIAYYAAKDAEFASLPQSDPLDHDPGDDGFCERDPYDNDYLIPKREVSEW